MTRLFWVGALAAIAACNTSQNGANDRLRFTPDNCGQVGGCDFADSIGVGGKINVTLDSLDGTPTAGIDLASRDPDLLAVEPGEDIGGEPSWELTALGSGFADLAAIDSRGEEIDFITVPLEDVASVKMIDFVGNPVEGSEDGFDQAWTVSAGEEVSWFIRPLVADGTETMGRFPTEIVINAGDPDITQFETASNDLEKGYFYVTPAQGDYPLEFHFSYDFDNLWVSTVIHAVAP